MYYIVVYTLETIFIYIDVRDNKLQLLKLVKINVLLKIINRANPGTIQIKYRILTMKIFVIKFTKFIGNDI